LPESVDDWYGRSILIFVRTGFHQIDWTLPFWTTMLAGMDADEQDICNYLKQWQKQFISGREICRRAGGKRRFREDPFWANQPLLRLVERQIIEADAGGHFRLVQKEKKQRPQKWISPELRKILEEGGKKLEDLEIDSTEDSQL